MTTRTIHVCRKCRSYAGEGPLETSNEKLDLICGKCGQRLYDFVLGKWYTKTERIAS